MVSPATALHNHGFIVRPTLGAQARQPRSKRFQQYAAFHGHLLPNIDSMRQIKGPHVMQINP
ncbi:hypothetical protein [Piscinibacter sp. HJYY11]|uniref:hypothetical protein n=1 Tax=Piscinibacter sp. HJYY11 TaxID=2801333 RepID=UPI00191EDC0C|nr:hypothetical protein [Piscinibacter sp. HJYY11]MBL0726629.1 hypothetical protein [Piscinibacter sp. HJYY11]